MYVILDADGENTVGSGETKYTLNVYSIDGDLIEVVVFWATPSSIEEVAVDELQDAGYVQLEAFDWTDAPYVSAAVAYAE